MDVSLQQLAEACEAKHLVGEATVVVRGVQHDSRCVSHGDLFVAVRGQREDGSRFVRDAESRGAVAVVGEVPLQTPLAQLLVDDARLALARCAELAYGRPSSRISTIGITGTNGKTTTAWLVAAGIAASGGSPATLGTLGFNIPGRTHSRELSHTTPEADDIARFSLEAIEAECSHLTMEVSSHALALRRVDAVQFAAGVFTNLSQDHLDFHKTMRAYKNAKARLLRELEPRAAVVNVDDFFGAELAASLSIPPIRCGTRKGIEVAVEESRSGRDGTYVGLHIMGERLELHSPMIGEHNVQNICVTLGCAVALGLDVKAFARGIETLSGVPGRMERIPNRQDILAVVDYAHTPDALERAVASLRSLTPGKLLVVFGCGGDRDRAKRPMMGIAACQHADGVVLTSDNPRSEDPLQIIQEIEQGVLQAGFARGSIEKLRHASSVYHVEPERRAAIEASLAHVGPGDSVLIAGKGHETYQLAHGEKRPFDDREEVRRAIDARQASV